MDPKALSRRVAGAQGPGTRVASARGMARVDGFGRTSGVRPGGRVTGTPIGEVSNKRDGGCPPDRVLMYMS